MARRFHVTSYTEVWIEICTDGTYNACSKVTSYTEVWIEITLSRCARMVVSVTSYTEVWIEIQVASSPFTVAMSLPTRKCGLK